MLMSIFFSLLLLSIQNVHGLICYSNGSFDFSPNEFHWNNFSNILNTINHPTISNLSSCHVRITVNYNNYTKNPYVILKFHPIKNSSYTNIEFGSTINFLQNQIKSYFDYTCSSGNLCDKIFLLNWARQFLNASNNSLHQNFLSLWKSSHLCQATIQTNYCESYLCFTIYNELQNLSYGKFQCKDQLSTNPVNIHIKTIAGNIQHEYQCRKNHCTGDIFYNSLLTKNSTGKLRRQKNENQINELIFKQTIIIVGILLIIGCIAFYIQCRKYKQGYRLTRNA